MPSRTPAAVRAQVRGLHRGDSRHPQTKANAAKRMPSRTKCSVYGNGFSPFLGISRPPGRRPAVHIHIHYSLYHAGRQKATPGKIFPAGVGRSAGSMTFRPAAGHTPCPRAAGDAGNGNPIVCPSLVCGRRMLRRQIRPAVPCPKMVLRRCGSGRTGPTATHSRHPAAASACPGRAWFRAGTVPVPFRFRYRSAMAPPVPQLCGRARGQAPAWPGPARDRTAAFRYYIKKAPERALSA